MPLISTEELQINTDSVSYSVKLEEELQSTLEDHEHDWTIWYVGISLLALTCVVVIFLIICVVWSTRRRRYLITEVAKLERPVVSATNSQFDNMVYLNDPEHLDLEPPTSNLYQRRLTADDPYMNEAGMYQDRIYPDSPYEPIDRGRCCSGSQSDSSDSNNVYTAWDKMRQPEDEPYEPLAMAGPSTQPDGNEDLTQECIPIERSIANRKASLKESVSTGTDKAYETYNFLDRADDPYDGRRWSTATNKSELRRTESAIYDTKLPEETESCSSSISSEFVHYDKYNVNEPVYDDNALKAANTEESQYAAGRIPPTGEINEAFSDSQPVYDTHIPNASLDRSCQNPFMTEPTASSSEEYQTDGASENIYARHIPNESLERNGQNYFTAESMASNTETGSTDSDTDDVYEVPYEERKSDDEHVSDRSRSGTEPIMTIIETAEDDSETDPVYEVMDEEHTPLTAAEVNDHRKSISESIQPTDEASEVDSDVYEVVEEEHVTEHGNEDNDTYARQLSSRTSETSLLASEDDPVYEVVFNEEEDPEHIYMNHPATNQLYMLNSVPAAKPDYHRRVPPDPDTELFDENQFDIENASLGDESEFDSDDSELYDTLGDELLPHPDVQLPNQKHQPLDPVPAVSEDPQESDTAIDDPVYDTLGDEADGLQHDHLMAIATAAVVSVEEPHYANYGVSSFKPQLNAPVVASQSFKKPCPSPRISRARRVQPIDVATNGRDIEVGRSFKKKPVRPPLHKTGSLASNWPAENSNQKSCSYAFGR